MKRENIAFTLVTAFLVCFIVFCVAGTVKGQETGSNAELEAYYKELENRLLEDTKTYLTEEGFHNSGVTLNRIVDSDGKREYTFTIHHNRIDRMSEAERQKLASKLTTRKVAVLKDDTLANCTFRYDFFIM